MDKHRSCLYSARVRHLPLFALNTHTRAPTRCATHTRASLPPRPAVHTRPEDGLTQPTPPKNTGAVAIASLHFPHTPKQHHSTWQELTRPGMFFRNTPWCYPALLLCLGRPLRSSLVSTRSDGRWRCSSNHLHHHRLSFSSDPSNFLLSSLPSFQPSKECSREASTLVEAKLTARKCTGATP